MMIVLLLLGACVCLGLADDSYVEEKYGKMYKWMLHRDTRSLEFTPKDNSEVTVLWKRHVEKGIDPKYPPIGRKPLKGIVGLHWGFMCCYYELSYLTQEDSGLYTMRDTEQKVLRTVTIEVIANTRAYELSPGESLNFTFDLKPNSCNIYFIPGSDIKLKQSEIEIVRQGRLERKGSDEGNCVGFQLSKPCGILIESLQISCSGRFEVRDQSDNLALVVSLKMKRRVNLKATTRALGSRDPKIGFGVGVILLLLVFCGCGWACCSEKSSSKEDNSETEAPETEAPAAPSAPEYESVGPRSDELSQPSGTHYPAQSSFTLTGPLVHDPTDDVPPSYSEVVASAEQAVVPSAPVYSDTEPQFQLQGMTFTSDSASVYTSDNLNFL